jgi:hypothetical protein
VAVGLVDQGSWGGGGKIWQRGRPGGGGDGGAVAAAVVLVAVAAAAAVVLRTVAEDQSQPLVGSLLGLGGDDGSS